MAMTHRWADKQKQIIWGGGGGGGIYPPPPVSPPLVITQSQPTMTFLALFNITIPIIQQLFSFLWQQ